MGPSEMAAEAKTFGELLRDYRLARAQSQEELAERAGLSARAISDLERGLRSRPQLYTVRQLVAALELGPKERTRFEGAIKTPRPTGKQSAMALPVGNFLGALPAGPLVAREAEMARLEAMLDAVAAGSGRCVFLAGDPGVGKTRLAQEVTVGLQERGFVVGIGRCYAECRSMPYYPLLDALPMVYAAAPATLRKDVSRQQYLGWLLSERPQSVPAAAPEGPEDRHRLFRAVAHFLAEVSANAPLALLIEDLHWIDSASIDVLQHLARQLRGAPFFLLGAYREVEVGGRHPLRRMLQELNREELVERLRLGPLDQWGTRSLIAALLTEADASEEFAVAVHARTQGNPFFTQALLRALIERGDVYRGEDRWLRRALPEILIPESVREAISERVGRLTPEAQRVLYEASVLGQAFRYEDLRAMNERGEPDVDSALEELLELGLVQEEAGESYSFGHVLIRDVLYTDLSAPQRRRLHRAASTALERLLQPAREKRAAEIAWHLLQGGESERALPWLQAAGDRAAEGFAHVEAEQQYQSALALAEELGESDSAAELREKLGPVLAVSGRYDEALVSLTAAANQYRERGDLAAEARVVAAMGQVHLRRVTPQEGIDRVQEVLDRLSQHAAHPPDTALLHSEARLHVVLARLLLATGCYAEALSTAERAVASARTFGEDPRATGLLAEAENVRRVLQLHLDPVVALQVLEDGVPLDEEAGNLVVLREVLHALGMAALVVGQLDQARRYAERSLEVARRTEDSAYVAYSAALVGWALFHLGDWQIARVEVEPALSTARSLTDSFHAAYALTVLGSVDLAEGRAEEGRNQLEAALAIAERSQDTTVVHWVHNVLADWEILQGEPDRARLRLEPLETEPGGLITYTLSTLAQAYLALGEVDRADAVVRRALPQARQAYPITVPTVLTARAMVRGRQNRWHEAEAALSEAVSLARSMSYPYAEAQALYEWGLMHMQCGRPDQARERLREALAIFSRLGARPYVERIERALGGLR